MGVDIFLNGEEAFEQRTAKQKEAFDEAVRIKNSFPPGSAEAQEAEKAVEHAYNAMFNAWNGYLRSSYDETGLFRVLDEVFGVDSSELLFPGDWDEAEVPMNVAEFKRIVSALTRAASKLQPGAPLPVRKALEQELGYPIPEPRRSILEGLWRLFRSFRKSRHFDSARHGAYLTEGLRELTHFAACAENVQRETNHQPFVFISY